MRSFRKSFSRPREFFHSVFFKFCLRLQIFFSKPTNFRNSKNLFITSSNNCTFHEPYTFSNNTNYYENKPGAAQVGASFKVRKTEFLKYTNRHYCEKFIKFTVPENIRRNADKTRKPLFPNWKHEIHFPPEFIFSKKNSEKASWYQKRSFVLDKRFFRQNHLWKRRHTPWTIKFWIKVAACRKNRRYFSQLLRKVLSVSQDQTMSRWWSPLGPGKRSFLQETSKTKNCGENFLEKNFEELFRNFLWKYSLVNRIVSKKLKVTFYARKTNAENQNWAFRLKKIQEKSRILAKKQKGQRGIFANFVLVRDSNTRTPASRTPENRLLLY